MSETGKPNEAGGYPIPTMPEKEWAALLQAEAFPVLMGEEIEAVRQILRAYGDRRALFVFETLARSFNDVYIQRDKVIDDLGWASDLFPSRVRSVKK